MHRTDLFIVSGTDLEYAKKKYFYNFMVNDAVLEYIIYIKNNINLRQMKKSIIKVEKSARLSDKLFSQWNYSNYYSWLSIF